MALLDADQDIVVTAPTSPRLADIMKRLRGRRDGPTWRVPAHMALDVLDAFRHVPLQKTQAFEALCYQIEYGGPMDQVQRCLAIQRGLESVQVGPRMDKPLYPYQERGVAFLMQAGSGILADEPGLGKTLQGIAYAGSAEAPCLIVCPASAKHVWAAEIEAATDHDWQAI